LPGQAQTYEGFVDSFAKTFTAFPDLRISLLDAACGTDGRIFCLVHETGTLTAPIQGMDRVGCFLRWRGLGELVISDGLICEFSSMSTLASEYIKYWAAVR
jgi:hypothetical protein